MLVAVAAYMSPGPMHAQARMKFSTAQHSVVQAHH